MSGQVQRRNAQLKTLLRSEFPRSPWGCAFLAYNAVANVQHTGAGAVLTVAFATEVFDLGNDYDGVDTFTAPATGTYWLYANVTILALTALMTNGIIRITTSNRTYFSDSANWGAMRDASNNYITSIGALCDMDAADTANITVIVSNGAGNTADIFGNPGAYTYFCGHRVS